MILKKSNWGLGPIQCNLEAYLLAVMGRMQGRPAGYCGPLWSCGQGDVGGGAVDVEEMWSISVLRLWGPG